MEDGVDARAGGPVVALVGCGRWGRNILRDLRALGCEVPVVVGSPENAQAALALGASRAVGSVRDLPSDVGAFVIATPTSTHAAVLDDVLPWGLPVYTEKPMTSDPAAAARLAREYPDRLFVMDKWRYHPGIEALSAVARTGQLGSLRGIRTARLQWGTAHEDVDPIWTLLPHDLSILLHLLGALPSPRGAVFEGTPASPAGLLAVLEGDVTCVVEVSAARAEHRRRVDLLFEHGTAVLDGHDYASIEVRRSGPDAWCETRPVSAELPLLRELRAFVEHVCGGPPPRSSAADGAAVVQAVGQLRALAGLDSAPAS